MIRIFERWAMSRSGSTEELELTSAASEADELRYDQSSCQHEARKESDVLSTSTDEEKDKEHTDVLSTRTDEEKDKEHTDKTLEDVSDNADGYDPFSAQSLGPLMTGNQYSMRKTASQALMDVALMMANISQLRTLLTAGGMMDYSTLLIVLVVLSLSFQFLFAIIIFVIWMRESEQHQRDEFLNALKEASDQVHVAKYLNIVMKVKEEPGQPDNFRRRVSLLKYEMNYQGHRVASYLNYATMIIVFIIIIINMFITGFGIKLEASSIGLSSNNT